MTERRLSAHGFAERSRNVVPDQSEFLPRGALLFILVILVIVTVAWLAMYAVLLSRGWR